MVAASKVPNAVMVIWTCCCLYYSLVFEHRFRSRPDVCSKRDGTILQKYEKASSSGIDTMRSFKIKIRSMREVWRACRNRTSNTRLVGTILLILATVPKGLEVYENCRTRRSLFNRQAKTHVSFVFFFRQLRSTIKIRVAHKTSCTAHSWGYRHARRPVRFQAVLCELGSVFSSFIGRPTSCMERSKATCQ